jgi:hypothetical protein
MVYISIPYVPENNRIDKDLVKKEIEILSINDDDKQNVYEAIYNLQPRGVDFKGTDTVEVGKLESALRNLGIPYRRLKESDY